jgi:hypothetical protein
VCVCVWRVTQDGRLAARLLEAGATGLAIRPCTKQLPGVEHQDIRCDAVLPPPPPGAHTHTRPHTLTALVVHPVRYRLYHVREEGGGAVDELGELVHLGQQAWGGGGGGRGRGWGGCEQAVSRQARCATCCGLWKPAASVAPDPTLPAQPAFVRQKADLRWVRPQGAQAALTLTPRSTCMLPLLLGSQQPSPPQPPTRVHQLRHPVGRRFPLRQAQLDLQHSVGEARDLGAMDGQGGIAVPPAVHRYHKEGEVRMPLVQGEPGRTAAPQGG